MTSAFPAVPKGADFTVVMPLFNKGPHVERAVRSVLAQTAGFHQLLVVDDNSDDDGPSVVQAIGDPRVRLMHRQVPGPGGYAARNLGIEAAESEWIAFLDADDTWLPFHTERLAALVASVPEADCAFTGYTMREPDGESRPPRWAWDHRDAGMRRLDLQSLLVSWDYYADCPMWTGAVAFRADLLRRAGLFPAGRCRRGGDKDLWLRAAALSSGIVGEALPSAVYHRDSVNMVTTAVKTVQAHCICETAKSICEQRPAVAPLMRRVLEREHVAYAVGAARSGRLEPAFVDRNPITPALKAPLAVLARLPSAVQPAAARLVRKAMHLSDARRPLPSLGQAVAQS